MFYDLITSSNEISQPGRRIYSRQYGDFGRHLQFRRSEQLRRSDQFRRTYQLPVVPSIVVRQLISRSLIPLELQWLRLLTLTRYY